MKIVELHAHHVRIPLRRPIRHASHTRNDTDNVVIRCVLDDGTVGHGEGVPRDYVTGETIDSALALLRASDLGTQLEVCRDFPAAIALAERLRLAPVADDVRGIRGNAAHCALELAVLDAAGRRFQTPLSAITARIAPEVYLPRSQVQYSGAITSSRGLKLRMSALLQRLYGLKQMKVKVGIAGYDDVKRLRNIRACVGTMDLRIDANEAWSPNDVVARIRELLPLGITSVEQPVLHEQIDCLTEVRRQVSVPIMHDESLCGMYDAEQAVSRQTCDLFNIRLSKCGGFLASLRLAQFAKKSGLGYQLGCQVGETAILSAAGRHFASTVGEIRYLEGSYDSRLVREALGERDITFGYGGKAPALTGPGLGVNINPQALACVTVRTVALL